MLRAAAPADPPSFREATLSSLCAAAAELPPRLTALHRQVLDYWEDWRGEERAPHYTELDPAAIRRALPHVLLWEHAENGDYRCRLAGTAVDAAIGTPLKGLWLSAIPCTLLDEARREFDAVRHRSLPCFVERTMAWAGKPFLFYRHLLLPLAGASGRVERLLGILTFHSLEGEASYAGFA